MEDAASFTSTYKSQEQTRNGHITYHDSKIINYDSSQLMGMAVFTTCVGTVFDSRNMWLKLMTMMVLGVFSFGAAWAYQQNEKIPKECFNPPDVVYIWSA